MFTLFYAVILCRYYILYTYINYIIYYAICVPKNIFTAFKVKNQNHYIIQAVLENIRFIIFFLGIPAT